MLCVFLFESNVAMDSLYAEEKKKKGKKKRERETRIASSGILK